MSSKSGEKEFQLSAPIASSFSLTDSSSAPKVTIGWRWQLFVFLVTAVAIVTRRPDAVFHPIFFAEDGAIWYADAYNFGWFHALLAPQNGYFQTLPRLTAALALLVPLQFAPLLMNVVAIVWQVLPVNFLLSSRCSNWAPLSARALFAVAYVCLPNSRELDATIEEGQWHIALLACLILLATPARNWVWRAFNLIVILLSGLTGPFCLMLLPVGAAFWWMRRNRWRLFLVAIVAACAILQAAALYSTASATRPQVGLGATPQLFLKLLAGQVYLGALLGQNLLAAGKDFLLLAVVAILGTAIVFYCFFKAHLEVKLFLIFCGLIYMASLKKPMVSMVERQWQVLAGTPGIRYWFFPMLAFIWALIWTATSSGSKPIRIAATCCLLTMLIGVRHDWKYPGFGNTTFPEYARRFAAAPPGTLTTIPLYPDGWTIRLAKKGPLCYTMPIGNLEQPVGNARISGNIAVVGWVSAPREIEKVSVYVDHSVTEALVPGLKRPDIDQLYPRAANKNKGWAGTLDVSRISPGKHEIEVWALQKGGCDAEFADVPVEVLHAPSRSGN